MSGARLVLFGCLLIAPIACGGKSTTSRPGAGLLPDLDGPTASVAGGSAEGAAGNGTDSGTVTITSRGELVIDTGASPMSPPAAPSGGAAVTDADLAADVNRAETIRIDGTVTSGGGDAVRTLTSGGDIVIAGTLRAADLGGARQGVSLNAPAGTVYIAGTLDTSGTAAAMGSSAGAAGGAITISARSIVVSGVLDASGGEARGDGAVTGGAAGAIKLTAGGDVWLAHVKLHGGGAESKGDAATGGAGATLTLEADGAVWMTGFADARGGPAFAAGAATAGAAGAIQIGQAAPPSRIVMAMNVALQGGAGPDRGGTGGPVLLSAQGGDLRIGGTVDFSGGSSRVNPGTAGTFDATTGPDAGGFALTGRIVGDGGDAEPGGTASGGTGARLRVTINSLAGGYDFAESGVIQLDGGSSSGSGTAGAGGDMEMICVDGNSALRGKLLARGGEAPDPGGVGGQGGILHIWTDTNGNGVGGNFIIETSGLIDVSGGAGSIGGSGRNNGGEGVALFPEHMEQLSVLIDTETIQGNSQDGVVHNEGLIVSRGGVHNGAGGDVMFHGRRPTGEDFTVSGPVDMQGDGTGPSGDFAGE